MRRLAKFVLFLIAIVAAVWFFLPKEEPKTAFDNPNEWFGDQESGCMYPVAKVTDGQNPMWWNDKRKNWDQFNTRQEAIAAGYRECP